MAGIKQAVILAGGRGGRLRPMTDNIPKPMVPINGHPFLEHLVELLKENGIAEIIMLLGYLPEKITEHFGNGTDFGLSIKYSVGSVDDLTGTRVRNAASLLAPEFLLLYGDNYWPLNLEKLERFYQGKGVLGMLTAYSNVAGDAEHGEEKNVRVEKDGRVGYYGPFSNDPRLNAVDIGFFLMKKDIVGLMPQENFSFEQVMLPKLIRENNLIAYLTDHPYCAITSIGQIPAVEDFLKPKRIAFLDRDGVINKKMPPHKYVTRWEEFKFLPGALNALKRLTNEGYCVYVTTNQRGIARGAMTEHDLRAIHDRMVKEVEKYGGRIEGIYYCPHGDKDKCSCRKPRPGMFFQAAREHHLNLTKTVYIGDDESDREAGEAAGCKVVLVDPEIGIAGAIDALLGTKR